MGFLAPAALTLTALLGLIIALHMLRLRRQDRPVSSVLLWLDLAQDAPASRPWRPLRRTPLLLLQLAALAALVVALARPWLAGGPAGGDHLILLLDRSASMAAREGGATRLEEARERLLDAAGDAPDASVTIVAFDAGMEVLLSGSRDPIELRRVVAAVAPRPLRGDAGDALAFAAALAQGQPGSRVIVFSDGLSSPKDPLPAGLAASHVTVGRAAENQGFAALSLEAPAAGRPARLFVEAVNAGRRAATRRLILTLDGRLFDARDVALPPGGRAGFTVDLPAGATSGGRVLEATLSGEDGLPLDDKAWLVTRSDARGARVAVLGPGNRFLATALGLLPGVGRVEEAAGEGVDLVILDTVLPPDLPAAPLMLIAPPRGLSAEGPDALAVLPGTLEGPQARVTEPEHPLVAGGEMQEVAILRALRLELGPAWRTLLVTEDGGRTWPLLAEGRVAGRPALVLAFDLRRSDLPLRPAFPLLMAAALDRLAPGALADLPPWSPAGEVVALRLSPRVQGARVVDPAGRETALQLDGGQAGFGPPDAPGLYRLVAQTAEGPRETAFAVNFMSPEGLDIRPREPAWAAAVAGLAAPGGPATAPPGRREVWEALAVIALVLLVAEGLYDQRGSLAPLRP